MRAGSSSSSRKAAASSPPAAPRAGRTTTLRAWHCIATRSAARPTSSTGCSRPTPPAAPPPNCCCSCTRGMMVSQGQRARLDRQSGAKRMIAGLPLTFAEPLLLLGLLSLPVLWWLLRVMPPRPRRIEFPPTRLLFDIRPKEETPSRTPWWLTAVAPGRRGAGHPGRRGPDLESANRRLPAASAPLVILLDDGWSAAASWDFEDQGRRRTDRQCRQRPPRRRAGSALRACARHHADAGRHRAGRTAPARAKPYSIDRVETPPRDRALPEGNRRLPRSRGCPTASTPGAAAAFRRRARQDHRRPQA